MGHNKLTVTTEPKAFHFDLHTDVGINLKHEIYSIIKYTELLAEHMRMQTTFINIHKFSKPNELHKFIPNLSQRLNSRSSNKRFALQNLSIYYILKNIR